MRAVAGEHFAGAVPDAMAAPNVAGPPVQLVRADALRPVTRNAVVFADPSRRDEAGRRRWRAGDFAPPLDELATVHTGGDLVVKCAPGMDFDLTPWAAEVELVSLDRDVREACLWSGQLHRAGSIEVPAEHAVGDHATMVARQFDRQDLAKLTTFRSG